MKKTIFETQQKQWFDEKFSREFFIKPPFSMSHLSLLTL